jgi:hypothetical protein
MNAELENAAKDVARKSALKLTPVLRDMAYKAEWPSDIIIQLEVKAEESDLVVSYPESLETRINDLEYGVEGGAPKPVIRAFNYRYAKDLDEEMSDSLGEILNDMGVFN